MQIKTGELTGAALDWAVAACEGLDYFEPDIGPMEPEYSSDWSQGGPIIEREEIGLNAENGEWQASIWISSDKHMPLIVEGPTPLIAAMRCYVASKLGDTVDVPDDFV